MLTTFEHYGHPLTSGEEEDRGGKSNISLPLEINRASAAQAQIFTVGDFQFLMQVQGESGATLKYSGVYGTVTGIARNEGAR